MVGTSISRRLAATFAAASFALGLAGCSGDDIEFNGKIFDAVGLNQSSAKSAEPKLVERAPLVMPPNLERVPEPGQSPEGAAHDVSTALNDPDKVAKVSQAELQRQQAEYCQKHYHDAKVHGDRTGADLAHGPLGSCRGSVVTAIQNWSKSDGDE